MKKKIKWLVVVGIVVLAAVFLVRCKNDGSDKSWVELTLSDGTTEKMTIDEWAKAYDDNEAAAEDKYEGAQVVAYGYVHEVRDSEIYNGLSVGPTVTILPSQASYANSKLLVEFENVDDVADLHSGDYVKVSGTLYSQFSGTFELRLEKYHGSTRLHGGPTTIEVLEAAE
jgi:uncharacterized protein YxeA